MMNKNYGSALFYRVFLLITALVYLIYELLYLYILDHQGLMTDYWRLVTAIILLGIFLLSYLSEWFKKCLEYITYTIAIAIVAHMIVANYLNNYELETALFLIVVIAVINSIFKRAQVNLYINIVTALIVAVTILLSEESLVLFGKYYFSFLSMVGAIYFINYKKIEQEETIQRQKNIIKKLHNISLSFSDVKSKQKICEMTLKTANELLEFDLCHVSLAKDDLLIPQAASEQLQEEIFSIDNGISGKAYQTGKSFIVNDIPNNLDAAPTQEIFKSGICVPIGSHGVFQAISTEKDAFSQEELELTEILIAHTETALDRINTQEQIRYKTFHDKLTGLYNRRFFEEELERLDTKRQLPLSIIIGDINNLKTINDRYGHKRGDKLIVKTAKIMKEIVRSEDILSRWGGDEFAILLPKTNAKEAEKLIERIKRKFAATEEDHLPVSMSIGLATKTNPDQNINNVLKHADRKMYQNKKNIVD